jgi:hypothetical protein
MDRFYSIFIILILIFALSTSLHVAFKPYSLIRPSRLRLIDSKQATLSIRAATNELLPENFPQSDKDLKVNAPSLVSQYFETLMKKLGKCSKQGLRNLIAKHNIGLLPDAQSDLESHITAALESLWSKYNGQWDKLLEVVSMELDPLVSNQ